MGSPLIIAEIGINHDGEEGKARQMIYDAALAGCKCVKFQCHIVEDEYIPIARNVIPSNATENIYDMMARCSFTEEQEISLKYATERAGMQYLSTPFSRAAADRLERMGVTMYKIGSGECNNYPLIKHIVSKGKPVILSTGMNDFTSIDKAVDIIGDQLYAILHCVSKYPTEYYEVNLPRMLELKERYHVKVGLSDHSIGIWTALAAVALGASVIEKHFTSNKAWAGADIPISIDPHELKELVMGSNAIRQASDRSMDISNENVTAKFAFASIVSIADIRTGMTLDASNIWVKRPGGGIPAAEYDAILGKIAQRDISKDTQLKRSDYA
jgi:N-acetylneuraminate synthase